MKKVATIILNRNLPKLTDKLYINLKKNNKISDFYILEAGSDTNKLSKNVTWHIKNKSVKKNGMRFARGMNQALSNLFYYSSQTKYQSLIFEQNLRPSPHLLTYSHWGHYLTLTNGRPLH